MNVSKNVDLPTAEIESSLRRPSVSRRGRFVAETRRRLCGRRSSYPQGQPVEHVTAPRMPQRMRRHVATQIGAIARPRQVFIVNESPKTLLADHAACCATSPRAASRRHHHARHGDDRDHRGGRRNDGCCGSPRPRHPSFCDAAATRSRTRRRSLDLDRVERQRRRRPRERGGARPRRTPRRGARRRR